MGDKARRLPPTCHFPLPTPHFPFPTAPLHTTMKEWLPAGTVIAHFQISSRISAGSETSLWVGNESGEGDELGARSAPAAFQTTSPAWSPDGRVIVCAVRDAENDLFLKLVAIGVGDKSENTI